MDSDRPSLRVPRASPRDGRDSPRASSPVPKVLASNLRCTFLERSGQFLQSRASWVCFEPLDDAGSIGPTSSDSHPHPRNFREELLPPAVLTRLRNRILFGISPGDPRRTRRCESASWTGRRFQTLLPPAFVYASLSARVLFGFGTPGLST